MPDFFTLAKVVGVLCEPLNLVFLVLLCTALLLWLNRWHIARWLLTILLAGLATLIFLPLTTWMLMPLEQRFPMPSLPAQVDGIIMLGGAQQPRLTRAYGIPALNERAERMSTFVALARRYPSARLVASGGSGSIRDTWLTETDTTRLFLQEQGLDIGRVVFEARSRDTYEHAVFGKQLVKPQPHETWLLVTSAADLPRAVGVFRKMQWPVLPVPCDYTVVDSEWTVNTSLLGELRLFHHAVHEWLGLFAYYLTGRIDNLFPEPG